MKDNKIKDFKDAMDAYNDRAIYNKFGIAVAIAIVSLQLISVANLLTHTALNVMGVITVLALSYAMTDFVNGLIHMYMDNNTNYKSIVGPFIAAFHMHHKQPTYKKRNPFVVYFIESGSKFWLVFYLVAVVYFQDAIGLSFYINLFLVSIGIFSSFAEVSHYWCHKATNNFLINNLQKCRILLPKKHHWNHHSKDNTHYAFLNGMTDPLINIIAKHLYSGYKNNSDLHVLAYKEKQTNNRN